MNDTSTIHEPDWNFAAASRGRREAEWCSRYAWLADRYVSAAPQAMRMALCGRYLAPIVHSVPRDGTIVDVGCGSGWLTVALAQLGAQRVIGIDTEPRQIELAKRKLVETGETNRVTFLDMFDPKVLQTADAVVLHGVLYRLSGAAIETLSAALATHLRPGAKIFLFEPVRGRCSPYPWSLPWWALRGLARLRRQTPKERRMRQQLYGEGRDIRWGGAPSRHGRRRSQRGSSNSGSAGISRSRRAGRAVLQPPGRDGTAAAATKPSPAGAVLHQLAAAALSAG